MTRRPLPLLLMCFVATCHLSCVDDETVFTGGRLEDPCNGSIPVCNTQAACVLENDEFYRSEFPGGVRFIVRSETEDAKLVVRALLTEPLFPGTEFNVIANEPSCGRFDQELIKDVDLFQFAGDDRIIEFELDIPGRGDHLVELFSDMSSTYLFTTTVEETL